MSGRCFLFLFFFFALTASYLWLEDVFMFNLLHVAILSFSYCYKISAAALSKCLNLSNISSGLFGNAFNVMCYTFLHTHFGNDPTWCLSWCLVLLKSYTNLTWIYSWRVNKNKCCWREKLDSFSNFLIVPFSNQLYE